MSWNVFSLVFWKPRATTTYCWCFVFDVVMCCGMKLLKPTCYFLNEGEVHKWIGGDRKKDGNFKIYLMAGSFLLCMRVSACVCLRERNGWRSWKNPQRWSRCSIFFFSTLHFCSSSFLGVFFFGAHFRRCHHPGRDGNELCSSTTSLWVVAKIHLFILRRHSFVKKKRNEIVFLLFFFDTFTRRRENEKASVSKPMVMTNEKIFVHISSKTGVYASSHPENSLNFASRTCVFFRFSVTNRSIVLFYGIRKNKKSLSVGLSLLIRIATPAL